MYQNRFLRRKKEIFSSQVICLKIKKSCCILCYIFPFNFLDFGFLICFLSRLFLQLEDFCLGARFRTRGFFSWSKSQDFKLVCANDRVFGCKAADCLKVAGVFDCLLVVFEKKRAWLLAVVWCKTVSDETRLTFWKTLRGDSLFSFLW